MIAVLDVDYREAGAVEFSAVAACVLARDWADTLAAAELVESIPHVEAYVPGEFYRRELPCLLSVLGKAAVPIDLVVVDGYVWLGPQRMGLGAHLYQALGQSVPVVGVGKTNFLGAAGVAIPVTRGRSNSPLWVTAAGISAAEAAAHVAAMHGEHRIPTLIKRADRLCRTA